MIPDIHWGCEIEINSRQEDVCDDCSRCEYCDPWSTICDSCSKDDKREICETFCSDFHAPDYCSVPCEECKWYHGSTGTCLACKNQFHDCDPFSEESCQDRDCFELVDDCIHFNDCLILCDICQSSSDRLEIFCDSGCPPCENCEYHCDIQVNWVEDELPRPLSSQVEQVFYDESCGPEIVSKVFETKEEMIEFHRDLITHLNEEGWNVLADKGSGGHLTISLHSPNGRKLEIESLYESLVAIVSQYYPVLLLNSCDTLYESRIRGFYWRSFPSPSSTGKHLALRQRNPFLIEFRYPDGTEDNELFAKIVQMIESMINFILQSGDSASPYLERINAGQRKRRIEASKKLWHRIAETREMEESIRESSDYQFLKTEFLENLDGNIPEKIKEKIK